GRSAASSKIARDPEADIIGAIACIVRRSRGRTEQTRFVAPRAATNDPLGARAASHSRAVGRRPGVAILVAILGPFPDVAVHLVQIPGVWLERIDSFSALAIQPGGAAALVYLRVFPVVIGLVRCYRAAPPEGRDRCGARHVFTFGFRQKAIGLPGLGRQP